MRFSFLTMLLVFAINHIPQLVRRSGDETGKGFMVQPFSAQMSGLAKRAAGRFFILFSETGSGRLRPCFYSVIPEK